MTIQAPTIAALAERSASAYWGQDFSPIEFPAQAPERIVDVLRPESTVLPIIVSTVEAAGSPDELLAVLAEFNHSNNEALQAGVATFPHAAYSGLAASQGMVHYKLYQAVWAYLYVVSVAMPAPWADVRARVERTWRATLAELAGEVDKIEKMPAAAQLEPLETLRKNAISKGMIWPRPDNFLETWNGAAEFATRLQAAFDTARRARS